MPCTEHTYAATDDDLRLALAAVEADALLLGFNQQTALTLVLMLEELYTNTIRHGRANSNAMENSGGKLPDSSHSVGASPRFEIRVRLRRLQSGQVELCYEDDCAPHDPFSLLPEQAISGPVEDRPVGRLGVLLLQRLSASSQYNYRDSHNQVHLILNPSCA